MQITIFTAAMYVIRIIQQMVHIQVDQHLEEATEKSCVVHGHERMDGGEDAAIEDGGMACSWGVGVFAVPGPIMGKASWGFWQTHLGPSGRP